MSFVLNISLLDHCLDNTSQFSTQNVNITSSSFSTVCRIIQSWLLIIHFWSTAWWIWWKPSYFVLSVNNPWIKNSTSCLSGLKWSILRGGNVRGGSHHSWRMLLFRWYTCNCCFSLSPPTITITITLRLLLAAVCSVSPQVVFALLCGLQLETEVGGAGQPMMRSVLLIWPCYHTAAAAHSPHWDWDWRSAPCCQHCDVTTAVPPSLPPSIAGTGLTLH